MYRDACTFLGNGGRIFVVISLDGKFFKNGRVAYLKLSKNCEQGRYDTVEGDQ